MRRGQVDHRVQRRVALRHVREGIVSRDAACDAHRELVRAGTHIGSEAGETCGVCDGERLRHVHYVFTGRAAKGKGEGGSAVPAEKLDATLLRLGDVKVYLVEVCLDCRWHHLLESFWELRDPVRRRTTSG